jgi:hypothetical protein
LTTPAETGPAQSASGSNPEVAPVYQQPVPPPPYQPQGFPAQGFPPQAAYQPLPPAKKGSGLKIVLVVMGVLVVCGVAAIAGLYYAAHRVKEAVISRAASEGIDLNSITSPSSAGAGHIRSYKACELLSQADAASMLGEPIDRIEDQGSTCLYYGPPGLSGKLAKEGAAELVNRAQQSGAPLNGNEVADSMSKIMNGLAAQAGGEAPGAKNGDVPLLTFLVDGDGRPQMTALTATKALFNGIGKAASDGKEGFGAEITGLGDKAVRLANLGLNVLKGDVMIRLIPGPVPNANDKTIAIARAILPKI